MKEQDKAAAERNQAPLSEDKKTAPRSIGRPGSGSTLQKHYGCRNLKFLLDLFDATGLTPHTFAQLTANPASTATALRLQLNKDDMKVSKARAIVDTVGYTLDIRFTDKSPERDEDPSYIVRLPSGIKKAENKYENLGFLMDFLKSHAVTQRGLADKIGMSPGAVFTWFKLDDIAISYLNRIKDAFDVNLEFNILTKDTQVQ